MNRISPRPIRGIKEAKEKHALAMEMRYGNITHVSPLICTCYGCTIRRRWLKLDSYR